MWFICSTLGRKNNRVSILKARLITQDWGQRAQNTTRQTILLICSVNIGDRRTHDDEHKTHVEDGTQHTRERALSRSSSFVLCSSSPVLRYSSYHDVPTIPRRYSSNLRVTCENNEFILRVNGLPFHNIINTVLLTRRRLVGKDTFRKKFSFSFILPWLV